MVNCEFLLGVKLHVMWVLWWFVLLDNMIGVLVAYQQIKYCLYENTSKVHHYILCVTTIFVGGVGMCCCGCCLPQHGSRLRVQGL